MEVTEDPNFYDHEIERLERRIATMPNEANPVVFYGSSSLRLWVRMTEDLSPMHPLNLGFGGSSFLWCMHHFHRLFQSINPKEIVLYVGDNDLGRGTGREELMERFHQLIAMIWERYPKIMIHYISIKPSPARDYLIPTIKWVNRSIQSYIDEHPHMKFINIYDGMLENGHHPNTLYYLSDLLHLNKRGYVVWKEILRDHFHLGQANALPK